MKANSGSFIKGQKSLNKGKSLSYMSRENHWNWKGGIAGETQKDRAYFYFTARKEVLKRDKYKCQLCGGRGKLHVDHINKWANYPELRFDIRNCRTLCIYCHKKTETFAARNKNPDFISLQR